MANIKQITLPSGTTYDLVDQGARDLIAELLNYTTYLGVTTTPLTDGATTNPIQINGEAVTATNGCVATYNSDEFIFNGTIWQKFGDLSGLGALAYADSASGSYTPQGNVSLTKTNKTATVSVTSGDATYTPSGSVNLTKTAKTATVSAAGSGDATYTPQGSISLTDTAKTPTITGAAGTAQSNTFQCGGSVGAPTISVDSAGATTTIKNPTKATVATAVTAAAPGATAPSNPVVYYSVSNEVLSLYQLGYNTGDSITTSDVTVKTGDASYTATAPTFTGSYVKLTNGSIDVPTSASFTGTGARLVTGEIQTADSASFTGTGVRLETGNISTADSASFTGTGATITVTP